MVFQNYVPFKGMVSQNSVPNKDRLFTKFVPIEGMVHLPVPIKGMHSFHVPTKVHFWGTIPLNSAIYNPGATAASQSLGVRVSINGQLANATCAFLRHETEVWLARNAWWTTRLCNSEASLKNDVISGTDYRSMFHKIGVRNSPPNQSYILWHSSH